LNFSPKNTFNGTDSEGGKFTLNEWEYGSIGNASVGEFWPMVLFWTCLMAIASPVMLLISLFHYRGLPQISNIVGILVGGLFLYSAYNTWMSFLFLMIFFSEETMDVIILITMVTMIGNTILLLLSIIFGRQYKIMIILITLIAVLIGGSNFKDKIENHNFYEYKNNSE